MIASAIEEGFKTVPDIIKAAAVSPLGIFALMIICLSVLGFVFFRRANQYIQLGIFLCLFAGVVAFGFSVIKAANQAPRPESATPTPDTISLDELKKKANLKQRILRQSKVLWSTYLIQKQFMPSIQESRPSPQGGKQKAEALADTLLKRIERDDDVRSESYSYEIETADVEATVDQFSQLFHVSQQLDVPIPCFDFREHGKAPIDYLPPSSWPGRRFYRHMDPEFRFFLHRWMDAYRLYAAEEQGSPVELAEPLYARSLFRDGLVKFLFSRFIHSGSAAGGSRAPSKGIAFDVYTKHDGERVHYTYSHLINTNPVFGAPTKHVSGYMKPGVWKFGVWKGPGVVLDPADFDVPAVNEAHVEL